MLSAQVPEFRPESLLTSHQAGSLLQVNPSSVNKWVQEGRLRAFRTPGGHRRILARELVRFMNEYAMPVPQSLAKASRRRLLWVDDDANLLRTLKRQVKRYANQVEAIFVENGIDALIKLGTFKPHMIVLDVRMPGVDGIEVARRIKAEPDCRDIDIIFVSAKDEPVLVADAMKAGARMFLNKPVELDAILAELGLREVL